MRLEPRLNLGQRPSLGVDLVQPVFQVAEHGVWEAHRLPVNFGRVAVEFTDIATAPTNEDRRKHLLDIRVGHAGRGRLVHGWRTARSISLPHLVVGLIVLIFGTVLVPATRVAKVLLEIDWLDVQAVVRLVQEQTELTIDVHRAEVLGRGAEQNDLVVARFQVLTQTL